MPISLKQASFISLVKEDLEDEGGRLIFNKGKYCGGKAQCNGLFYINADETPTIKVAKGSLEEEEWIGILIHEYCHFLQWKEDCKIWRKFSNHDVKFEEIFSKPQKKKKVIEDLLSLELDCEKRSLRLIKANKLIDAENYCKTANAVLFKYAYLYNKNKWPTDTKKYNLVLQASPKRLLSNSEKYLHHSAGIISIYD
jgi:hypothetical protein